MVTKNARESAALAINNGCDLNCGNTYLHILGAVQDGLVSEETITEAAVRLFTTRCLLGLFDGSEYDAIPYTEVESPAHLALAEKAAQESFVLLKNNGILPLEKSKIKTIGVIGPNANSRAALVGNYHGTASRYVTILEGLQDYLGEDVRVLTSTGCELFRDRTENLAFPADRLSEAKIVADNSDVVVLCVGLDETLEGEEGDTGNSYASGDKMDLQLPQVQRDLMEAVKETGKPVVLCLMAGSDIDLSYASEHFDAVLAAVVSGCTGRQSGCEGAVRRGIAVRQASGDILREPGRTSGVYRLPHGRQNLPLHERKSAVSVRIWIDVRGCMCDGRRDCNMRGGSVRIRQQIVRKRL